MKLSLAVAVTSLLYVSFAEAQSTAITIPQDPDATIDVIVKYRPQAGRTKLSEVLNNAGRHNYDLSLLRSHALTSRVQDLETLASSPEVEAIYPDNQVAATAFSGTLDYGWMTVFGLTSGRPILPYDGTGVGVWGSNVLWGTSGVMGSGVLWGANVIWGTKAIVGSGTISEESANIALNGEQ